MDSNIYRVRADWDPEGGVWVATSQDVSGLVTEAETIEILTSRLRTMIPELLEARGMREASVTFELTSHRQETVTHDVRNEGLVDWLLACPEKGFFVALK